VERGRISRLGRRGLRTIVAALAVIVVSAIAAPVAAAEICTEPSVLPVGEVRAGMKGTALTVVQGRSPVSFNVEVLGVLPDGIAPGIDFILVKTSGRVIDDTGGIAAGMSGSPVYMHGKLVGSISYGFSAADQTIGGVTPIEPMLEVMNYPSLLASAASALKRSSSVRLTAKLERAAAAAAGVSSAEFPSTARQLRMPVAVSGLNARGLDRLNQVIQQANLPFATYRAGSAQAVLDSSAAPLVPGAAVGAAASYGDLTFAGVGTLTATALCGDEVRSLAFGHPFFFDGETGLGWNAAEVLTVVPDPSNLFGPFKIANLAELRGTVDQDRLAAIRAVDGELPQLSAVTSHVENPDLGTSRDGRTDVARQDFMPFLSSFHLLLNQDRVFDRLGAGSSDLSWTIRGTRASGEPFELVRRNMYYSPWDISFESIFELEFNLFAIQENGFESVRIDEVALDSEITQRNRTAKITRVLSASSLQPALKARKYLFVRPGDMMRLRVFLLPAGATVERSVDLSQRVPRTARGEGVLAVGGGGIQADEECFFGDCLEGGEEEVTSPASFDELLAELSGAEHSYDLVASLGLRGGQRKTVAPQGEIILGRRVMGILVVR
jgi:SpoIVB peptidase S55